MRPIRHLAALLRALAHDRRGATAIEYGLILALIVVAMFVSLRTFSDGAIGMWNYVSDEVTKKTNPTT